MCGHEVRVASGDEGTNHYEPVGCDGAEQHWQEALTMGQVYRDLAEAAEGRAEQAERQRDFYRNELLKHGIEVKNVATRSAREVVASGRVTPRTEVSMLFQSTLPLRFWRKVYAHPSGCWLWMGYCLPDGYGQFWIEREHKRSHRLAFEDSVGPITSGLTIDHLCRVRRCVGP
jgi:hypothetical protein